MLRAPRGPRAHALDVPARSQLARGEVVAAAARDVVSLATQRHTGGQQRYRARRRRRPADRPAPLPARPWHARGARAACGAPAPPLRPRRPAPRGSACAPPHRTAGTPSGPRRAGSRARPRGAAARAGAARRCGGDSGKRSASSAATPCLHSALALSAQVQRAASRSPSTHTSTRCGTGPCPRTRASTNRPLGARRRRSTRPSSAWRRPACATSSPAHARRSPVSSSRCAGSAGTSDAERALRRTECGSFRPPSDRGNTWRRTSQCAERGAGVQLGTDGA